MDNLIKDAEKNLKKNKLLLNRFELKMISDGIPNTEIKKHIDNVEFYINDYLPYDRIIPAREGCSHIKVFFSDWFIKKALWSSPKTVEESIISITRFYEYMYENNQILKIEYNNMMKLVKKEREKWIENG